MSPTAFNLADPVQLTKDLVDFPSESRQEGPLADAVESSLRRLGGLTVDRVNNNVVARTNYGSDRRIVLGGHLDTVPSSGNLPHRDDGEFIHGLGTADMKGGVACSLNVAATLAERTGGPIDVTFLYYECEEIDESANGLKYLATHRPELLSADFAVLMEPSNASIEAGCQGTLRAIISTHGTRAHSARSWLGRNAVHEAADLLNRLQSYEARRVEVSGLEYREGLNAVGIAGGIAGNVIPDKCELTINYRFAPDRDLSEAKQHIHDVFPSYPVEFVDLAPAAKPGLEHPMAQDFLRVVGKPAAPKLGWTDVARFSELGIPAVNYGPGDPNVAHAVDERVAISEIRECSQTLHTWLAS